MVDHDVAIVGGCVGCSIGKHLAEKTDLDVVIVEEEIHSPNTRVGGTPAYFIQGSTTPRGR